MRKARSQRLDNLCEALGEQRDIKNEASVQEASLQQSALQEMQRRKIQVYKHAKIELARVPGSEKLRVRRIKDEGDASVESGDTTADNAEDIADIAQAAADDFAAGEDEGSGSDLGSDEIH